jgi:hypothetical protein
MIRMNSFGIRDGWEEDKRVFYLMGNLKGIVNIKKGAWRSKTV